MRYYLFLLLYGSSLSLIAQNSFEDISSTAGIDTKGANYGVAFGDFNNDGWEDIYVSRRNEANHLYRNLGDGTFEEIALQAGVAYEGDSRVAIWGDINNDGWLDLYVGNKETGDLLYLNNQNESFTNISVEAGLSQTGSAKAAAFADVDNDGLIDIYIAREYVQNTLYKNIDGTSFLDRIYPSGALDDQTLSMGLIFFDYDNDRDLDLYLTHDAYHQNLLYQNDGNGVFTDVSVISRTDYRGFGMGVDFADINNDGWLDFYITNLYDNTLYLNNQNGTFSNIITSSGANDLGMGWGTAFLDINNDGWEDIYVANNPPYPNICFQNNQDNTFQTISTNNPLGSSANSYGMACADINNDGWEDIFLANLNDTIGNQLLLNQGPTQTNNNWIKIKTVGSSSNRSGIGARVEIHAGNQIWIDEVSGGMGYSAQNSLLLTFGLGTTAVIDRIRIYWPSGVLTEQENIAVNQFLTIYEEEVISSTISPLPLETIQSHPNPFTSQVNIRFEITASQHGILEIISPLGKPVARLHQGTLPVGTHHFTWNSLTAPKGLYLIRLQLDKQFITRPILRQ